MKSILLSVVLLVGSIFCAVGQSFLNGSFERNYVTKCTYNQTDSEFNARIPYTHAFGNTYIGGVREGEADILTKGCYVDPVDSNWCIGLASDYEIFTTSDAVSLELSEALTTGKYYEIRFYAYGNISFDTALMPVMIGESVKKDDFGRALDTLMPVGGVWTQFSIPFMAGSPSKFITVKNLPGKNSWNQVDQFSIRMLEPGNVHEPVSVMNIYPNPANSFLTVKLDNQEPFYSLQITDVTGQCIYTGMDTTIDIKRFSPGIYFLTVYWKTQQFTMRFVKN